MNFYQKPRRTPALQIISMIDILIILLIFLVVSTTFKQTTSALNISLPTSTEMALGSLPADNARLTLSLTKDDQIYLTDLLTPPDQLPAALAALKSTQPTAKLELKIDEKASFGLIIQLWDALTQAGYPVADVPARILRPTPPPKN